MTGLVGRIALGQVVPRRPGPQNPENAIQHIRGSRQGRPRPSTRTRGFSSSGASTAHCASVRSTRHHLLQGCVEYSKTMPCLFMRCALVKSPQPLWGPLTDSSRSSSHHSPHDRVKGVSADRPFKHGSVHDQGRCARDPDLLAHRDITLDHVIKATGTHTSRKG